MDLADLHRTCEHIGVLGGAYYFELDTLEIGEKYGLDAMEFYFIGRGGVLGNVEPTVVSSAFGYFNPQLVEEMWHSANAKIAPREGARLYASACHQLGRSKLADLPELESLCAALEVVNQAADTRGLPLYAGHRAEPLPDDLPARAMHLLAVLREFRGAAHLCAIVASGIDPKKAHYMRRPDDMELFGWDPAEILPISAGDRLALERADELTDRIVAPAYDVLDPATTIALLGGLVAAESAL